MAHVVIGPPGPYADVDENVVIFQLHVTEAHPMVYKGKDHEDGISVDIAQKVMTARNLPLNMTGVVECTKNIVTNYSNTDKAFIVQTFATYCEIMSDQHSDPFKYGPYRGTTFTLKFMPAEMTTARPPG